ncbi:MAG TPA: SRPBCC family protein [Gaiellales bacterium]|jgi:carbon monoxide dehydrogenase subunit G|nr:SRPBCC family protein [Gaiellales bacterium]
MRFENEFSAPAPADEVFAALMDIRSVASCVPGATIGADTGDGGLEATVAVTLGPIRMTYGGTVHVTGRDDAARTATMRVAAREQRGQGTAEATLGLAVAEADGGHSRATVTTDLMVTGRVAQMGSGIMQDVAGSMVNDFAACLSGRLGPAAPAAEAAEATAGAEEEPPAATAAPTAPPAAAGELRALPLLWRAIKARLRRIFGRG